MSAINIPLSIMFSDILACRMILDLRERGYEISQPTVFTHTLPLHTHTTDGTGGSSTIGSGPSSLHKGPFSATQNSLPFTPTTLAASPASPVRSQGIKGLVGNSRSATATALTTTIDSAMLSQTQSYSIGEEGEVRSPDESSCVEMRSFTHHPDESDQSVTSLFSRWVGTQLAKDGVFAVEMALF